eukprot:m.341699 g.341699  ORF g.341699 m.341699 type:complete len:285 (+) comp20367_c0_seq1:159-1013(+)
MSKQRPYNVRERHSRAIFINVPVAQESVAHLLAPDCSCQLFNGKAWVTVLVDDLDVLQPYMLGMFMPSMFSGWMMKVSLLVSRKVDGEEVSGYQIIALDFEQGFGGWVKTLGARFTQKIPSHSASFEVSCGKSGKAHNSPMEAGTPFHCKVNGKLYEVVNNEARGGDDNEELVTTNGSLEAVPESQKEFLEFVVNRPNKFLRFCDKHDSAQCAYSPEGIGPGVSFSTEGAVLVSCKDNVLPVLNRFLKDFDASKVSSDIVTFLLPSYTLVDHHNRILPSESVTS